MSFELDKKTTTDYYIKELNTSLDIDILTNKLILSDKLIEINYIIIDTGQEYSYKIEMSD